MRNSATDWETLHSCTSSHSFQWREEGYILDWKNPQLLATSFIFGLCLKAAAKQMIIRSCLPVIASSEYPTYKQGPGVLGSSLRLVRVHHMVHPMVLCSVSQQRAAKTSSLPLEATPSRRSPHWPDARRPPKGERTSETAFQLRRHSAADKLDSFYPRWHVIFIVLTIIIGSLPGRCDVLFILRRYCSPADSSSLYSLTCRQAVFFACRAWIFDCRKTFSALHVCVLLVLPNSASSFTCIFSNLKVPFFFKNC